MRGMERFAVIGVGHFGEHVMKILHEAGKEVIAVDADEEKVQAAAECSSLAIMVDATDKTALREAGIGDVDVAIISLGDHMDRSTLAALHVKELGVPFIAVKAISEDHGKILHALGVQHIVHPEKDAAVRLGNRLAMKNVLDYMPLLPGYSITEMPAPPEFVGRTLRDLALRNTLRVQLIAIYQQNGGRRQMNIVPRADDVIHEGDILILLGETHDLERVTSIVHNAPDQARIR